MADLIFPISSGKSSWSGTQSQTWDVTQTETASGRRRAICGQLYPRYTLNVAFKLLTDADVAALTGFYAKCKGQLLPFWYRENSWHVEKQQLSGNGGVYQCVIKNGDYVEPCYRVDDVQVYLNGYATRQFTVSNGAINVNAGTAVVTASYDYYQRVRFDNTLSVTQRYTDVNSVDIKLVTVR